MQSLNLTSEKCFLKEKFTFVKKNKSKKHEKSTTIVVVGFFIFLQQ